jgi:23S rRNA pseudouridine1911/1915/1917 synthase
MPLTTKSLEISATTPEDQRRLDRIVHILCGLSRSQIRGLFDHSQVFVNGEVCQQPWRRLVPGDQVQVRFDPLRRNYPRPQRPQKLGFEILHEDEHIIVVNKAAGLLTVPTPRFESNTLIQRISNYLTQKGNRRSPQLFAVQRLDRGVSGIIVFAKSSTARNRLREQFQQHTAERIYLAIVAGQVHDASGTFRSYLATSKSLQRYSTKEGEGELAITHFEVIHALKGATFVRVQLETGRRNQIRVHFAEAGHPVLGDDRYETHLAQHPRWNSKRLALHAFVLAFQHPITGEQSRFETAIPPEFLAMR